MNKRKREDDDDEKTEYLYMIKYRYINDYKNINETMDFHRISDKRNRVTDMTNWSKSEMGCEEELGNKDGKRVAIIILEFKCIENKY